MRAKGFNVGGYRLVVILILIVGALSLSTVETLRRRPFYGTIGDFQRGESAQELTRTIKLINTLRTSIKLLPGVTKLLGAQASELSLERVHDEPLDLESQHSEGEAIGGDDSSDGEKSVLDNEDLQSHILTESLDAATHHTIDVVEKTLSPESHKKQSQKAKILGGSAGQEDGVMIDETQIDFPSEELPQRLTPGNNGLCDFTLGRWEFEPAGPLYHFNQCRVISTPQNCQANGRPDSEYESYRWQPQGCHIPRFDALAFLKLMRGKTLGFVGDSLARNQMESLMCLLLQVTDAEPNGKTHRYYFPAYQLTIIRVWSSWLVRSSGDFPESLAPKDAVKLDLMDLDENITYHLPKFDVTVVSSGHWWFRKTAYFMGGGMVGGAGWDWEKSVKDPTKKIDTIEAFRVAIDTTLRRLGSDSRYSGLTILRTYTPDHYKGGRWNSGGSCSGETMPLEQSPQNSSNEIMYQKQIAVYQVNTQIRDVMPNGSRMRILDVFPILGYRAYGHPGVFRSSDPVKRMVGDEKGRSLPSQDCLHWCLPGPMDAINELLFQILKEEM